MTDMDYIEERKSIIAAARYMRQSGMVRGTSGNISVKLCEDRILVTPSGLDYDDMEPEDICLADMEGRVIEARRKPSSETPLHLAAYKARPDAGAVVHAHSEFSTVMASLCGELPAVTVPGCAYWPVRSIDFRMPGSAELADAVARALGGSDAVIMAHHGLAAVGKSLAKAMEAAEYVEENARIAYRLLLAKCSSEIAREDILELQKRLSGGGAI